MEMQMPIAAEVGLASCHSCQLLMRKPPEGIFHAQCPRCGATLHTRKPRSLGRTWAYLVAAVIFYFPAMALPIMTTTTFQGVRSDTILSGIYYLLTTGMWPLAAIVFFASVVVPILKIIILIMLVFTVQRGSCWRRLDRTRLYRLTEAVGRWSMVDIYVVTILVALVRLQALAVIEAEPGAVFFASVVVLTMFAAKSFDPRLIWDKQEH
ncbi:paraquat-inducible protein A [Desulfovibrio ferrophilus]|uniref:Paraquat-inducible protein A n=1 Tax=Desulfovibrio ferrophilus TaxID=241368 RepID=A0A2Z6AWD0_9BACT|nr:paraquat-inducible protein A [Desulfovibrio ferrophilus]BBD07554.1 Paraquat-inducible protein A [Desulfovibrio ferrophilus]